MSNISRYRQYLILDYLAKTFEKLGYPEPGFNDHGADNYKHRSSISLRRPSESSVATLASVIDGTADMDKVREDPYKYFVTNEDVCISFSEVAYDWHGQEEQERLQSNAEARIFALLAALPGSIVLRSGGDSHIVGRVGVGGTYRISFGRALCERVVVGTKKVKRAADPVTAAKIMEAIEQVEVDEPVYEWRCNDAELMAGAI